MSLTTRFLSFPGIIESLAGLPPLKLGITTMGLRWSLGAPKTGAEQDSRLKELKQQLAQNGGRPPFMIDNGMILRAAPKKKHSHRRTRMKLYASGDKKVQPLHNLVRCPACGHVKRSHFMCMNCFAEIRAFLKAKKKSLLPSSQEPQANLDPIDQKLIYPGKFESDYERRLKKKDWIPKREKPLVFNVDQVKPKK